MVETLQIDGKEVVLDQKNMDFNEGNLSEYLKKEAAYYNHFGWALAEAESELAIAELDYDKVYGEKYAFIKDNEGGSDKMVEAKTLSSVEVSEAKLRTIQAKENVKKIYHHLRAWDKSHENALNLGYMLRKEMEKIGGSHVMVNNSNDPDFITNLVNQGIANDG